MASTIVRLLPATITSILSLIAFVFSLLAVTAKEWGVRHNFDPNLNPLDWKTPIYTLYRSPFTVCTATLVNSTLTGSSAAAASDFQVHCTRFRPRGFNHTSCELAIATQDDTAPTIGDARLCQQIHYAGDFWIASTVFIGLAFLLTIVLAVFTCLKRPQFASQAVSITSPASRTNGSQHDPTPGDDTQQLANTTTKTRQGSAWVPWVVLIILTFFFVGFATALISQYYGVLGFIQSLPNNADFASSSAGSKDDVNTQGSHGPWFQGIGLSVYATCAWGFSIAAGVVASKAWSGPQWSVTL